MSETIFSHEQILSAGRLVLGDKLLEDVRPIIADRPATKAGRLSLKASLDGRPVKVYECASEHHANFIFRASRTFQPWFPICQFTYGTLAVCDWVPGNSANTFEAKRIQFGRNTRVAKYLAGAGKFLEIIHNKFLDENVAFDYVDDFLVPKFRECCQNLQLDTLGERLLPSILRVISHFDRKCFVHPDLSPANVVLDSTGMKIIDNELFGCSSLPALDELNLVNSLRGSSVKKHPQLIKNILVETRQLFEANLQDDLMNVWSLRKVTSWFLEGNFDQVYSFNKLSMVSQRQSHGLTDRLTALLS